MQEDLDADLQALFRKRRTPRAEEPFVSVTANLIRREHARRSRTRLLLRVAAVTVIAVASPWLIQASVVVSNALDALFVAAGSLLGTTPVLLIAALCALPLLWFGRKRLI
jgi:hypothetical protein